MLRHNVLKLIVPHIIILILSSVVSYTAGLTLENELIIRNVIRREPICSGKRLTMLCTHVLSWQYFNTYRGSYRESHNVHSLMITHTHLRTQLHTQTITLSCRHQQIKANQRATP